MPKITVRLALEVEGFDPVSKSFEESIEHTPHAEGMKYFVEEGEMSLRTDLLYAQYMEELPSTAGFFPETKGSTYRLEDVITGKIANESNKKELWRFVGNSALAVNIWLAKAKALHSLQQSLGSADERLDFILHFEKLDKLHLAINAIATLRDLHKRIVREALGGVRFDVTLPSRQQRPARSLKEALKHRSEFEALTNLNAAEIALLEDIAEKLEKHATKATARFLDYKSKLGHDTPQIVDNPKFYPSLDERKKTPIIKDGVAQGETGAIGGRRTKPDWTFDDLFDVVVAAFGHYLGTLRLLRTSETFKP